MPTNSEPVTTDDQQPPFSRCVRVNNLLLAPRRRKEIMLPQVSNLALEGHSCRAIGKILGLDKTTVHRWLQELREESRSRVADATEMIVIAVARYDAIYREAMEAWRTSNAPRGKLAGVGNHARIRRSESSPATVPQPISRAGSGRPA